MVMKLVLYDESVMGSVVMSFGIKMIKKNIKKIKKNCPSGAYTG